MEHRPDEAHAYVFTIAGRCLRCQRTESEHLKMLDQPDAMTECPADHKSVNTSLLIGEHGLEWRRCPFCHVMVEGALVRGEAEAAPTWSRRGKYEGPGQGVLTARQKANLLAWAGWVEFNGGENDNERIA